jgi:1-deoxy-D-xylulose-5-phosphate reductoisomerase
VSSPREVVLLGSTGSIGTQAIDIARRNPDRIRIVGLGAGGGNVTLLAAQALELGVDVVGVAKSSVVQDLQLAFYAEAQKRGYPTGGFKIPKIFAGPSAMAELAEWPCDTVLNGVVGSLGLAPTLAALRAGRTLALANKESLVAGGPIVRAAMTRPGQIIPVDSEHSALFQLVGAEPPGTVERLVLTASGGPFRGRTDLAAVTPDEALAHPTWEMGGRITIDSATLMNKGFELIEAHHLFGLSYERVDVVVHPQSIVHALVHLNDGATLAHLGYPDMRVPISYALHFPERADVDVPTLDLAAAGELRFEQPDVETFACLRLAGEAGEAGGTAPCVLNAADEVAVAAFLDGRIPFPAIAEVVERTLEALPARKPGHFEDLYAVDLEARERARELIATVGATR